MIKNREELHEKLCNLLGSRNVYFQPPENVKLKYPCIIYERVGIQTINADNKNYLSRNRYTVTVIDKDPESEVVNNILLNIPYSSYDRHFASDNLNHDVFTIYY